MKQLLVNDGGSGSFVEVRPEVLGIFDTLLTVRCLTAVGCRSVPFALSVTLVICLEY